MPVIPQYKLTYFPFMGRAETARLLFALAEVPYEDERIEMEQWPAMKPNTEMGVLPILEMDGKRLAQSHAINRFLARMFGLAGADDLQSARIDMLAGGVEDVIASVLPWHKEQDPEKKSQMFAEVKASHIKPFLDRYSAILRKNATGFFVGDTVSWCDLYIFHVLWYYKTVHDSTFLDGYDELAKFVDSIAAIPQIKNWMEKRPKTNR